MSRVATTAEMIRQRRNVTSCYDLKAKARSFNPLRSSYRYPVCLWRQDVAAEWSPGLGLDGPLPILDKPSLGPKDTVSEVLQLMIVL